MQEVLVVMPRRRGKTYATAMMAAALILTVPECSVAVFSTGIVFLLMSQSRRPFGGGIGLSIQESHIGHR